MTPNELISIVANNVEDGGFTILARDEYLAFVNDVAHDLWMKSRANLEIHEYPLPAGAYYYDLPDTDVISFVSMQIRTKASPEGSEPSIVQTEGDAYLVSEKPTEQAIRQNRGLYASVGDTQPGLSVTPELRLGRYRIHAAFPFEAGWVLTLHCITTSPMFTWLDKAVIDPTDDTVVEYEDREIIWEPFRNLFEEGVTWRAARRVFVKTKDSGRKMVWNDSKQNYYSMYLPEAVHYIHSMKDASSVLKVEPFNFLPE